MVGRVPLHVRVQGEDLKKDHVFIHFGFKPKLLVKKYNFNYIIK